MVERSVSCTGNGKKMSDNVQAEQTKARMEQMLAKLGNDEAFRNAMAEDATAAMKSMGFSDDEITYINRGTSDVQGHDYEIPCRAVFVPYPSCYWTNGCYLSRFWYWY